MDQKIAEMMIGGSEHEHAVALAGPVPVSPEHASALRQAAHEPEPIPEGKLFCVRPHGVDGSPLEGSTEALTHDEAVVKCAELNESAAFGVWFGVAPFEAP